MAWCGAINCSNSKMSHPNYSFFQFPKKDADRAKRWLINLRRADLMDKDLVYLHKNIYLCPEHFEDHMFMNSKKNKLVWNAVPTLFKISNPPGPDRKRKLPTPRSAVDAKKTRKVQETQSYIDSCLQRQREVRALEVKNRNSGSMKRIRRILKAKNDALRYVQISKKKKAQSPLKVDQVLQVVKPLLSRDELILLRERLQKKNRKGPYSEDFKRLCISISFKSTSTYKYLSKKLHLPPKSTISRWMAKVAFDEGFDEEMFKLLEKTLQTMPEGDRVASLLMDEMTLKELMEYDEKREKIFGVRRKADGVYVYPSQALALMVRGLKIRWKQVVAYFFSSSATSAKELHHILLEALDRLAKCGLKTVNVTSDQGGNFSSLLGRLGVHEKKPYFIHQGMKVFVCPDPPHLHKSSRNALLDHDIQTPDGVASWEHIKMLFDADRRRIPRLAPKLSLQHIEPPPLFGKMSVSKAAQVLSNTASSAMQTYVQEGVLPRDILPTAKYCSMMNRIFDVLNSSRKKGVTACQSALSPENEEALTFIKEAVVWIKSLKILDKEGNNITPRFRFVDGLVLALSTSVQLMHHITATFGFEFLLTRRLCQVRVCT